MLADLYFRFRAIFHRQSVEAGLDDELQFHLEQQAEKFKRAGMSPADAMRRARIELGGVEQVREECRDAWGTRWLGDFRQDLQFALRILRQNPMFAAAAILSLALGIGANTAIFTVVNSVMLKSLPVREPSRLMALTRDADDDRFTNPLWEQIRDRQDIFSGVFAYGAAGFGVTSGGEQHVLRGMFVSGDYFSTLGVHALLGRTLTPADDQGKHGPPAAIAMISYGYWQREFGGDSRVLDRSIRLNGHPFQVIGVTPPEFFGLSVGENFDVAVPLTSEVIFHPDDDRALTGRSYWWLHIIGRLTKDENAQQAARRLNMIARPVFQAALPTDFEPELQRTFLATKLRLKPAASGLSDVREHYAPGLTLLMGVVGIVLLLACANVANLLLARASARQREIAVRLAIGASRSRLIRQLLTESALIAFLGAAAGTLFAFWSSRLLVTLISSDREPRFLDLTPDWRVIAFTFTLAVLTGILFGLAPALQAAGWSVSHALKQGAPTHSGSRWSLAPSLVSVQVALSLVLVAYAGLFAGTLQKLLTQELGFRSDGVLLVDPDLQTGRFSRERQALLADKLLERLQSLPAVQSAARSVITPIQGGAWQWDLHVDSTTSHPRTVHCFFNLVSPHFFQTLGTPLLAGRDFTPRDTKTSPLVAVVNEAAARQLFPGENAIGRIYHDEVPTEKGTKPVLVEVIGIAKDAKYRQLRDEMLPTIYLPITQNPAPFVVIGTYELRFIGRPAEVITEVKKALAGIDPELAARFHLLSVQVADSLLQEKLLATVASFFGILALLLASVGLYGVVSYSVTRRRNEIGVRIALGADQLRIMRLVLGEAALVTGIGLAVGLALAEAGTRFISSFLYGLTPNDPVTFMLAILLLAATCLFAAYLPARRVYRSSRLLALHAE